MFNKNLTDAEIKKVLECCARNESDCQTDCPIYGIEGSCFSYLIKPILDLINRKDKQLENKLNQMPNKLTDKELKIIMKATEAFNGIGIERYTKAGIFVGELLGIIDRLLKSVGDSNE